MSQQGFLLPLVRYRLLTPNGAPAVGFRIYFYASGTSTPQDTYSDSQCTTPNTNPVVLDAQGEALIFLPAGTLYRVSVHDASDTPVSGYPVDGVESTTAAPAAPAAPAPVPTGGMLFYGAASAPTGYLLCDGSAVSRTTYAALFAVIASAYGAGNGSTTFNVPDLRQRFPLGLAASGTGSTLGATGGAVDHTHTGPSHTHSVVVTRDGWGHSLNNPATSGRIRTGNASGTGTEASAEQSTGDLTVTSGAAGTGDSGTANPPFCVGVWLIKT